MRVATWNLENLFRPNEGSGGPDDQQAYTAKLATLAATITAIAPDLLAVQEVGSPEALDDLVAELDGDWSRALAEPDGRGIRVGFLSRLPLTATEQTTDYLPGLAAVQIDDDPTTTTALSRPLLSASVDPGGGPVQVVSCHFKSKLLTFPGGRFTPSDEDQRARFAAYALNRRAAEAATTRALATRLIGGDGRQERVIVLGDLNDTEYSATTTLLQGPGGSEIGSAGFDRPDQGDAARLWNLGLAIPPALRFSRVYQGRGELIDHILVSHALLDGLGQVTTADPTTGSTDDPTAPSIGDRPGERRNAPGSDHRPVLADLAT